MTKGAGTGVCRSRSPFLFGRRERKRPIFDVSSDYESLVSYDVLIVGASVRAAASSVIRAGYRPWCADQFADRDLASLCPVERIEAGGDGFERLIERLDAMPRTPWFYTGGLENHPRVVERVSQRHRLWGAGSELLAKVRDPERVAKVLHESGLACPRVSLDPSGLPCDGSWLLKSMRSGGGVGIQPYYGDYGGDGSRVYYQQRVEGESFSALYIGAASKALLVGVSRQLVGIPGSPFAYRGSVGPVVPATAIRRQLERLGDCLSHAFGLRGWFGVDYLGDGESIWPVEVNPRYTASVEIHELAARRAYLRWHIAACEGNVVPSITEQAKVERATTRIVGKCILYAGRTVELGEISWTPAIGEDRFAIGEIADIPHAGTRFEPGDPVLSVFAEGTDAADCDSRLFDLEREWRGRLKLDP
jgi:predicted ATP-grasp superfamily ATP-dependent carboligase